MVFKLGSVGPRVRTLQQQLQQRGFNPGQISEQYTVETEAAVRLFQQNVGLDVDGIAGPNTIAALAMPAITSNVTLAMVSQMFPQTPRTNIRFHLPFVLKGLLVRQLADRAMVLMALGTIRAEAAVFQPIDEQISDFNTPPGGAPFSKYDNRADLGNQGSPDGERFKGRGFVQLTGRANYRQIGQAIGLGSSLVNEPEMANEPEIAAQILAAFLRSKEMLLRQALAANDLAKARELVNGGHHGLADFQDAFRIGQAVLPIVVRVQATVNAKPVPLSNG